MNDGFAKLSRRAGSELTSLLMLYIMLFAEGFMVRLARFESLVRHIVEPSAEEGCDGPEQQPCNSKAM